MPFHLLFPLLSSILFVLGMMLVKRGIDKGASPWSGTFLANLWLALVWVVIAVVRGRIVPMDAWPDALLIGLLFVLGQVFTYLAFQFGDVSVATPIFGIKVLLVAALVSLSSGEVLPVRIWIAGALATSGVILIQWSGRAAGPPTSSSTARRWLTIILALSAATSLTLFDVAMQDRVSGKWNSHDFLPVVFGAAGLMSFAFLPWTDRLIRLRQLGASRWILAGTVLMAMQAMSMTYSLATFGDATRINIVYSLRGLWGVALAWLLGRSLGTAEGSLGRNVMLRRLAGALLLTAAVMIAIG